MRVCHLKNSRETSSVLSALGRFGTIVSSRLKTRSGFSAKRGLIVSGDTIPLTTRHPHENIPSITATTARSAASPESRFELQRQGVRRVTWV